MSKEQTSRKGVPVRQDVRKHVKATTNKGLGI